MQPEEPSYMIDKWYRNDDADEWHLLSSHWEFSLEDAVRSYAEWCKSEHHQVRIQRL